VVTEGPLAGEKSEVTFKVILPDPEVGVVRIGGAGEIRECPAHFPDGCRPRGDGNAAFGSAESLFGWKSSEVLGRPNPAIPADRECEFRALEDLVLSGKTLDVTSFRRRKDGALLEVRLILCPLRVGDNTIGAISLCKAVG
jgi:PAS domain-containing protein